MDNDFYNNYGYLETFGGIYLFAEISTVNETRPRMDWNYFHVWFSLSKVLAILTDKLDSGYLTEQGPMRLDLLTGAATIWDWLNFI